MAGGWAVREGVDREDSERHAEILGAAREAFEERGFAETSVADIAQRAGVSRATFYVYFASKQDVLKVLAEQLRQRYLDAQALDGIDEDDVEKVLSLTMGSVLDAALEHHAFVQVLDNEALRNPEIARIWRDIKDSAVTRAAVYIRRAHERGLVDPVVDPYALALMGGGLNDKYAPLVLDDTVSRAEAVRAMTTIWTTLVRVVDR